MYITTIKMLENVQPARSFTYRMPHVIDLIFLKVKVIQTGTKVGSSIEVKPMQKYKDRHSNSVREKPAVRVREGRELRAERES